MVYCLVLENLVGRMNSLANFVSCFKSAIISRKSCVEIPFTKFNYEVLKLLKNRGFISSFSEINLKKIIIFFKFSNNNYFLKDIRLGSKPSKLIYTNYLKLSYKVKQNIFLLISNSKGLFFINLSLYTYSKVGGKVLMIIKII
jgi:ribosomal protein S8